MARQASRPNEFCHKLTKAKQNETPLQFSELAGPWNWGSGCWASADGGSTFSIGTWSRLPSHPLLAASQPGPTRGLRSSPEPDLSLQVLSADHLPLLPHISVSLCILSFSKDSPPRVHSSPCSRHLGTTQHLASLPSSKHPSPTVILASLQLPGPLETHQVLGQEPALVQPTAGA